MRKISLIAFVLMAIFGCHNTEKEDGIPDWLEPRINELTSPEYAGTIIYRYDWNEIQLYHVMIPISSCAYCEMYSSDGDAFEFINGEQRDNFIENKENEYIVWSWQDE